MHDLFHNRFVRAVGVGVVCYAALWAFALSVDLVAGIIQSVMHWYRYDFMQAAEELSIVAGLLYLLLAAVVSSRSTKE